MWMESVNSLADEHGMSALAASQSASTKRSGITEDDPLDDGGAGLPEPGDGVGRDDMVVDELVALAEGTEDEAPPPCRTCATVFMACSKAAKKYTAAELTFLHRYHV